MSMKNPDYGSYEGCMELVEKIRRYWARKGLFPTVVAERARTISSCRDQFKMTWYIASNMVDGWPRGQA